MPDKFLFTTIIPVRITDMNYGNHLGNDALLTIIHEARVQFLSHFGYSEMNIEGTGIIMADVAIQYKSEAFYGDQLFIEIAVAEFTQVSFDIFYKITVKGKLIVLAKTGMVCYDYSNKKIVPVSPQFIIKMGL